MRITSRYRIAPHGPKRLEVTRNLLWSEVIVRLDRVELGRTNSEELTQGVEFELRDGSILRLLLQYGPRNTPFLYLTLNGRPLPGSEGDPAKFVRDVAILLAVVALLQIALAILIFFAGRVGPTDYAILAAGLVLLLLAFLTWKRSVAAIVIGSAIAFAEIAGLLAVEARWDITSVLPLTFAIGVLVWFLHRGIVAAIHLKKTSLPVRQPVTNR